MQESEIQGLIDIRKFLIHRYSRLDSQGQPGTAVMLQKDVAYTIEESIRRLDKILKNHVKIQK